MRDVFLEKSEQNLDAAKLLYNESLFCSSVHCSYYSSYQMMIHVLFECLGETEQEHNDSDETNGPASHNHLINKIRYNIKTLNRNSFNAFNDNIRILKELRKDADYKSIVIFPNDSKKAIEKTETVIGIVKSTFKI